LAFLPFGCLENNGTVKKFQASSDKKGGNETEAIFISIKKCVIESETQKLMTCKRIELSEAESNQIRKIV
jgi:hypothetical protein